MNAANPVVPSSFKELGRDMAHRAWRSFLAILVVGIAIAVGVAIPYSLADQIGLWAPAGLAFGAATVLAVLKDLLQTLPTAVEYIVSAVSTSLPKLFAQVAVAALGVGFAWYAAVEGPKATPERSLNLNIGGTLPPIVLNDGGSVFATYLVFGEWKSELGAGDAQLEQVDALVQTLAECIQDADDRVQLTIRAYASSSGPDFKNLELYRKRGKYVDDLLETRIAALAAAKLAQFKVDVLDWKSLEAMKLRRLFKDTDNQGTYLPNAGALNRRADILVRSAGSCLPG